MNRLVHALQICLLGSLCAYAQTPPEALKSMVPDPGEVSRKGDMARMA